MDENYFGVWGFFFGIYFGVYNMLLK